MRILWLVNIALPEASQLLGETPLPFGGWLASASESLAAQEGIDLFVAFPRKGLKSLRMIKGGMIDYYAFPPIVDPEKGEVIFEDLIRKIRPDIVHIHGTEYAHCFSMTNVCDRRGVPSVISIQGLVSFYAKHQLAGLPWHVVYGFSLRNLLKGDSVIGLKKQLQDRGRLEIKALEKVKHIIGRTEWDKACSKQINPEANYHFCNEGLRGEFYKHKWKINQFEKYSIFVSQGNSPIKGLHFVLEGMKEIINIFPEARLYVGGRDRSFKSRFASTYYMKYIKKMIREFGFEGKVFFTGLLNEEQMCERFLKTHVFVSASTIENSPNSLCEAQILGVPLVCSFVGGVGCLIKHGESGFLYQHDAPYMLAHYVCKIFDDPQLALRLSEGSRKEALRRHDREENTKRVIEIYSNIINNPR